MGPPAHGHGVPRGKRLEGNRISRNPVLRKIYDLALRCGIWNVEDPGGLIYQITDWQTYQWLAYDDLSPISDERGDLQAGIVASSVVNEVRMLQAITRAAHGDKDPRVESTSPGDFMPLVYRKPKPVEPPTTTGQWNAFKASVRSMGEGMKKGTVQ